MDNNFVIPPSPNWFNSEILACAPDNTLIYGTKSEVVVIHPTPKDEPSNIEVIPDEVLTRKVVCVDVTPKWDSPNKWVVCSWEDHVKIWDLKNRQWKKLKSPYKEEKDNFVGARFMSEDRILSVTESGAIGTCYLPQLKFTQLANIFQGKVIVTCFAPCPHSPHLAAFGFKNGLISVVDLKKKGTLLHKLRGHTAEVISLSWCPSPMNIFPRKPGNVLLIPSEIDANKKELSVQENLIDSTKVTNGETQKKSDETSKNINEEKQVKCDKNVTETSEEITSEIKEDKVTKESVNISLNEEKTDDISTNALIEKIEDLINEAETKSVGYASMEVSPEKKEISSDESTLPLTEEKVVELENNKNMEKSEQQKNISPSTSDEAVFEFDESGNKKKPNSDTKEANIIRQTEEPIKELLLSSCAKDSYINIWRATGDGRLQCFIKVDKEKSFNNKKGKPPQTWMAIKWITPFRLLSTTPRGAIRMHTLPRPLDDKKGYKLVHGEHSNFVFAIAAHVPILTEDTWFEENEIKIWSFSYDLCLVNTILNNTTTHLSSIETFCSLVICMAYSPIDPNRIAIGLANGTIKVWNANNSSPKFFSTANYSPKIFGKITCLEWHPTNELIIAFSTEEGTVGLINTNTKQKATWFKQCFSSAVYRIQWAPYEGKICLFAVSKGSLRCFNPDNTKEEPIEIKLASEAVPYYFSWKLDKSMMLMSHLCGKITVYDANINVKASYYNNKKLFILVWHPESENSLNPRSFWVASAIDNVVYIFDFAEVKEKDGILDIEDVVKTKIPVHYENVKSIAWNPFVPDQLVTAGDDGLAFILDASNGTVLSSYYNNRFQPIKTIMWSPIEENLLIMGMAKSAMLIGWKSTDFEGKLSDEIVKEFERRSKNSKKMNVIMAAPKEEEENAKKIKKIKKTAKNSLLPYMNCGTGDTPEESAKIMKQIMEENKETELKSNFGKLFGTKEEVLSLLELSENSHIAKEKLEAAAVVSAFKGDLQKHLTEAIEQLKITPLLISLAPTVSVSLWQKACEAYAKQMAVKPDADPLEVALYYLTCNNIEKAIEYLCEKEMFKEALVLAKTKLPEDSVVVEDIVVRWAKFSSLCGNLETGALCFIKIGRYEDACKMLFRRNDLNILSLALELARKTGNAELIKAVEFRYNAFSKNESSESVESKELKEDSSDMKAQNGESTGEEKVNGEVQKSTIDEIESTPVAELQESNSENAVCS